jgi:hypothetical protein
MISNPQPIARFHDEALAHLAAGKLEAHGIETLIETKMPGHGLGRRTALLSVPSEEKDHAILLLLDSPARSFLLQD